MVKPIDPHRTQQISHPDDEDDPPTLWEIRGLTKREVSWLSDRAVNAYSNADKGTVIQPLQGTVRRLAIKLGLVGVQNYAMSFKTDTMLVEGRKVPCVHEDFLDSMPVREYDFVSDRIQSASSLDDDDMGGSSPSSTSSTEE